MMSRRTRRNQTPGFEALSTLAALTSDKSMAELA